MKIGFLSSRSGLDRFVRYNVRCVDYDIFLSFRNHRANVRPLDAPLITNRPILLFIPVRVLFVLCLSLLGHHFGSCVAFRLILFEGLLGPFEHQLGSADDVDYDVTSGSDSHTQAVLVGRQ
uniref:(northern house mosquito) hypothetical protein n=1 Tax=Culex pipiens TaxID=7175 RepID=A0A8D8A701_CULPI